MGLLRRRVAIALSVIACAALLAGCVEPTPERDEPLPSMGWMVDVPGTCNASVEEVRAHAEQLVQTGLRDAGFRTVLVLCSGRERAKYRTREEIDFLSGLGLRLGFLDSGRGAFYAAMPRSQPLRTVVTRRVMEAELLIASAPPATLSPENLEVLTNRDVMELLRDPRAAPGAPVLGNASVYSRAIGERGLLVSLTNGRGAPKDMSVGVADLGLSGDDVVPARDVWTGERITASDGALTIHVDTGDTALLRIG